MQRCRSNTVIEGWQPSKCQSFARLIASIEVGFGFRKLVATARLRSVLYSDSFLWL